MFLPLCSVRNKGDDRGHREDEGNGVTVHCSPPASPLALPPWPFLLPLWFTFFDDDSRAELWLSLSSNQVCIRARAW